jgi:thiosulfate reductase cytochrome b subunit
MTADASASLAVESGEVRKPREVIYRHAFLVRLTHWINALAIVFMIGTGLNIFNAHPRLYWGVRGDEYDRPLVSIQAYNTPDGPRGLTKIGPATFDTTGVLGLAQTQGHWIAKAWPSWITIPSFQDLADARRWHFLVAWFLVGNGVIYGLWALLSGHARKDLWPTRADLRSIPQSIIDHIKLKHPTGEAAKRYNVLQRFAYIGVITLITGMVATGLTMSPGVDAAAPWLLDLFGGRQTARTLHFVFASLIVLFVIVHLTEVVLAGPLNEIRSMITGRYAVPREHD